MWPLSLLSASTAHTAACCAFCDTGRFTAAIAKIVKLGAADFTAAFDFDGFDQRGVKREDALDTFAVRNFADREAFFDACAGTGDTNAFKGLQTCTCAFCNPDLNNERVAS